MARRHFRQGGDERGAAAGDHVVQAHAFVVAAVPSGAQDRRAHPRARTRPQRHRDAGAHAAPAARADHRRSRDDRLGAAVSFRLALRGGDRAHGRALCRLHLLGHRVAHRHPPQDERERYRRQRQGDRFAAQLRDGQIFLRRRTRGQALRPLDGALRGRERAHLHLARGAQCRAGRRLHLRARRGDGARRLWRQERHQDGRRLRHDQRHDDSALSAAEFHGSGLSRDQTGADRHRDDVLDSGPRAGNRGPAGRAAAQGGRRLDPLRKCLVRLRAGAADPQGPQLRGRRRPHRRHRRAFGRRQVDHFAAPVPLLRRDRRPHSASTASIFAT